MISQRTAKFRQETVRVALTSGLNRKQGAADFGVGFLTLSHWIQLERREFPEPTAQGDLEAEVSRLRKENRLLREERGAKEDDSILRESKALLGDDLRPKFSPLDVNSP